MSKKSKKQPLPSAHKQLFKWLDSYEKASAAVEKHGDLLQLLEQGGGICKIEQFLPVFVAEGIHQLLEQFSEADWNVTAANDDYTHNNIAHEFLSTKSALLESVFRVFTLLLPDSLFTFSAAKYCRQGHIKPHDDRAYTQVRMEDGSIQLCSRNIACIYYLTKDWTAADGGLLIDHEAPGGPRTHVPAFNSVICFTIPRWHEVTPVVTSRPRYSIFGWFLEPGKLYELQLDPQLPSQQTLQQRHQQKKRHKSRSSAGAADGRQGAAAATAAAAATQPAAQQQQGLGAVGGTKKRKKRRKLPSSEQQQQQSPEQPPSQQPQAARPADEHMLSGAAGSKVGRSKKLKQGGASGSHRQTKAGKHRHGSKVKLL